MTNRFGRTAVARGLAVAAAVCLAQLVSTAAFAAELVMFDGKWCGRCKQFLAEVGPVYHTTPPGKAMPLRVVDSQQVKPWFRVQAPIEGTPTFVLVDKGVELGRIVGYTTREAFLQQSYQLMGLLPAQRSPVPKARPPRTRDVHAQAPAARIAR